MASTATKTDPTEPESEAFGAVVRRYREKRGWQLLGHKSLATTQVYTAVRPARLAAAVHGLDYAA